MIEHWLQNNQFSKPPKSQIKWYKMHPFPHPSISHTGKSLNAWSGEVSPLNSSFTRIFKTVSGISPVFRPIPQETMRKWKKSLKESTVIINQAANRWVNKFQEDMQEHIKTLFTDNISKGKSSQKMEKVLTKLLAFQQNSYSHWTNQCNTWRFVQDSDISLLHQGSYLEHLKPGVKPDT